MSFLSVEHGKLAYWSDFAFYGVVVAVLSGWVAFVSPRGGGIESTALVLLGLASWSLIEYLIHRFVLHGIQPFSGWHERHHSRPAALVSAPTVLSATLLAALVFLPTLALGGLRTSSALSLGVLSGYLVYSVVHHATHHWRADSAWAKRRKLWHAMHHRDAADGCCYGVTSRLWDHVFATALRRPKARIDTLGADLSASSQRADTEVACTAQDVPDYVEARGTDLVLNGIAPSLTVRHLVRHAAWSAAGVRRVLD